MNGVKRRKWWLIALSVALLAACVGVWKWSTLPPRQFRFMAGAVPFASHAVLPDLISTRFAVARPLDKVLAEAELETGPGSWEVLTSPGMRRTLLEDAPDMNLYEMEPASDVQAAGLPADAQTVITVLSDVSLSGNIRRRFWELGYRGWWPSGPSLWLLAFGFAGLVIGVMLWFWRPFVVVLRSLEPLPIRSWWVKRYGFSVKWLR